MTIPLLDLKAQYDSIKVEIDAAVLGVLESGHYVMGPNVKALEQEIAEYCGTNYAVGVANGTDALILSLEAYGISSGDEVITTPYSFFATAEAISRVGANPVFVDIDERTYNINVSQIESKITKQTKAILPVHLFGQMALMDKIMDIAQRHKLIVIEDACQAIGANYKGQKAGSWGHAACFSFFPTKNLGGYGDGGIITTNDEGFAETVKMLRFHGSRRKYYNEAIGHNSRLDELQAAILRVKLKYLDRWNEARREKAEQYNYLLQRSDLVLPYAISEGKHIYHLYIVRHNKRADVVAGLKEYGSGCGIYYPVPLHLQDAYEGVFQKGTLPVVEQMSEETFALPLFPEMSNDQLNNVASCLRKTLNNMNL
ncbi:MAG: DegT/DnrJ/EryC1/StrS family aminotransferase [Firmicutes bacterium]|nr:DegT/DnrJ/EryC1/StrS family aminotransferase [Bacillota bacterium]